MYIREIYLHSIFLYLCIAASKQGILPAVMEQVLGTVYTVL